MSTVLTLLAPGRFRLILDERVDMASLECLGARWRGWWLLVESPDDSAHTVDCWLSPLPAALFLVEAAWAALRGYGGPRLEFQDADGVFGASEAFLEPGERVAGPELIVHSAFPEPTVEAAPEPLAYVAAPTAAPSEAPIAHEQVVVACDDGPDQRRKVLPFRRPTRR